MPYNRMIRKAGKLSFLLVCLFLCTACGKEKAVFRAGEKPPEHLETEAAPKKEEHSEIVPAKEQETEKNHLVNINTADAAELQTLSGIGRVRAEAIIAYRQSAGEFGRIEDIMNVKGIKTGIFNKISSNICVK